MKFEGIGRWANSSEIYEGEFKNGEYHEIYQFTSWTKDCSLLGPNGKLGYSDGCHVGFKQAS